MRERGVLLLMEKNRRRRGGGRRKTDVGKISRLSRDSMDRPTDGVRLALAATILLYANIGVERYAFSYFSSWPISSVPPFYACARAREREIESAVYYTFISFTGQVIL